MNKTTIAALVACAAIPGAAQAQVSGNANVARIPAFHAMCPENTDVVTKDGGPILVNGKETKLMTFSKDFTAAALDNITVTVEMDANDAVSMTFTNSKTGNQDYCKIAPGDIILGGKKIN